MRCLVVMRRQNVRSILDQVNKLLRDIFESNRLHNFVMGLFAFFLIVEFQVLQLLQLFVFGCCELYW